jgi:hypothetical protein
LPIFQIAYLSSLVTDDSTLLPSILEVAIRNNSQRGITGMMLYSDGNVMQVLEGEKDVVLQTFQSIEADMRHTGVMVLLEHAIAARQFASWSMGFKHLAKADLDKLPGAAQVFKAREDEISTRARGGDALILLKTFSDGLMGLC